MKTSFRILGSGAGPGAPSFFCECPGCQEDFPNPPIARTRSGACITTEKRSILLDTPPDLRIQLIREKIKTVSDVFITHWHYDHFGGLGELEYYVKLHRKEAIPLYLPPSAVTQFSAAFPNLLQVFSVIPWEFGRSYLFDDISIVPLAAAHHGIETAGFLINSAAGSIAYFPDTAGLPAATSRQVEQVDWLICDATFHGENWFPESHMTIVQAIELGQRVKARHTVLTHLSVHYSQPVTSEELAELTAKHHGVIAAYDGMAIKL